ncbi:MAG: MarR family winged helix-turn-helix transcriptional regulator [Dehalococcoidales bacterium]|jgi:DNA-binding MarR family transcriptional regulator
MPDNRNTVIKPIYDSDYSLWLLLSETRSAISKARHKKVGLYLPPNQAAALVSVWALDGQATPAVLSRHLFLEPHTVSELVNRMHKNGLVTKKKDMEKGNMVRIAITAKGRQVCRKMMGQEIIRRFMEMLSEEQRKQLRASLMTLYKGALQELGITAVSPLLTGDGE